MLNALTSGFQPGWIVMIGSAGGANLAGASELELTQAAEALAFHRHLLDSRRF
jgi:hypothetical protein